MSSDLYQLWHFAVCWTNSMSLVSSNGNTSFYFGGVISSALKLSHRWTLHCVAFLCFACRSWLSWLWCGACHRFLHHLGAASFCIRNAVLLPRCCTVKLWGSRCREPKQRALPHWLIYILVPQGVGTVMQPCALWLVFSSRGVVSSSHLILSYSLWQWEKKHSWSMQLVSHSDNYHSLCLWSFSPWMWHRPHLSVCVFFPLGMH